jgi:hypothetical protein
LASTSPASPPPPTSPTPPPFKPNKYRLERQDPRWREGGVREITGISDWRRSTPTAVL